MPSFQTNADEPESPDANQPTEEEPTCTAARKPPTNGQGKPEWKRYKQYTRHDIMSAIQCVRDGMSALQASRKYGVPARTLYDKVKKLGITTNRPSNRSGRRSANNASTSASMVPPPESTYTAATTSAAAGSASAAVYDGGLNVNEHHQAAHRQFTQALSHTTAAALLDPTFLQQAIEAHGGAEFAGRDALHAMALAAAAHAALHSSVSTKGAPNAAPFIKSSQSGNSFYGGEEVNEVEDLSVKGRGRRRKNASTTCSSVNTSRADESSKAQDETTGRDGSTDCKNDDNDGN